MLPPPRCGASGVPSRAASGCLRRHASRSVVEALSRARLPPLASWLRAVLWSIAWLVAAVMGQPSRSQDLTLEYTIEATYLRNLSPFVTWPNARAEFPGGAFILCVVGGDPFGDLLDRVVSDQQVDNHPIVIRRFAAVIGNPDCSVMYVTGPVDQVAADLTVVREMPVLTVTDNATDPAATGIINFLIVDNHVRFDINNSTAAAGGLIISSKLLSLAVHVTGSNR